MHLKHPDILWALLLLLIPLIVHLFRLRRFKKEIFTNVRFLREVDQQTRKSSRLKKWLVLTARLLALAMLILAFTGPYLGDHKSAAEYPDYIVYLDNSQSMSLSQPQGPLLDQAVHQLLEQWPEKIPLSILTNDDTFGPGTSDELRNRLLTLDYSAVQLRLDEVILKARTLFPQAGKDKVLYLYTDLQTAMASGSSVPNNDVTIRLHPLTPSSFANLSVDSLRITGNSPESIDLEVMLSRSGITEPQTIPVSVLSGSELLGRGPAVFETDTVTVRFSLPPEDLTQARISITDNGLPYDNTLYFNIPVPEKIRVLHIADDPQPYLKRIFSDDEFTYTTATTRALDLNTLASQHLVILDGVIRLPPVLSKSLTEVAGRGVSIVQIPSAEEDHSSFLALNRDLGLPQRDSLISTPAVVNTINYDHPLFKGVFNEEVNNFQYPQILQYFTLTHPAPAALELAGGLPFLYGRGNHYAFSAPIDQENTDLIRSALVVPVFYAIGLQSMRLPAPYYLLGDRERADIPTTLEKDEVLSLDNGIIRMIPRQESTGSTVRIYAGEQLETPGHYGIVKGNDRIGTLSVNHSRAESILQYTSPENLQNTFAFTAVDSELEEVKSENKVNELWKWFVIFAIAFFLTEMLLLKYFK